MSSSRSLVIVDEFGRNTSVIDGIPLSLSLLKYLVQVVGCATVFVTHFIEDSATLKSIIKEGIFACHLAYLVNEQVQFLQNTNEGFESKNNEQGPTLQLTGSTLLSANACQESVAVEQTQFRSIDLTYLYKVVEGCAPVVSGVYVARTAGLDFV